MFVRRFGRARPISCDAFCEAGFVAMMGGMDPILDEHGLAQLLKATDKTLTTLLDRTDLPRFTLDGERRFLTQSVLAWVARHEGGELIPVAPEEPVPEPIALPEPTPTPIKRPRPVLSAAAVGEPSWFDPTAIEALDESAGDAGRNLDRLKLRDALLELNDSLLPVLTRLSEGRLHPHHDEKLRTSPWRLDLGSSDRIESIGIAWGAGEHAPPAFSDRPHVEVVLGRDTLTVQLDNHGRVYTPALDEALVTALAADGFELEVAKPTTIARTYTLPMPVPTLETVATAVQADLARLIPLWVRLV